MERKGTEAKIFSILPKYFQFSPNIFTCECETQLDILAGGGGDSQVLVGS